MSTRKFIFIVAAVAVSVFLFMFKPWKTFTQLPYVYGDNSEYIYSSSTIGANFDIQSNADISFHGTNDPYTTIIVTSDILDQYEVTQWLDTIYIQQAPTHSESSFWGGNKIVHGDNSPIITGNTGTIVIGNAITPKPQTRIEIYTSQVNNLDISLSGSGKVTSDVSFNSVTAILTGNATLKASAENAINLTMSGNSDVIFEETCKSASHTINKTGNSSVTYRTAKAC